MVHYIQPEYASPLTTEPFYMKFCSKHDKAAICFWIALTSIGAAIALYTLFLEYVLPYFGA